MPYRSPSRVSSEGDVLSERELTAWWDDPRRERPYDIDRGGADLCAIEDELLFVVGTLCLRNGQRALWSAIYTMANADSPAEEAFEFVERMTHQVRHGEASDVAAA